MDKFHFYIRIPLRDQAWWKDKRVFEGSHWKLRGSVASSSNWTLGCVNQKEKHNENGRWYLAFCMLTYHLFYSVTAFQEQGWGIGPESLAPQKCFYKSLPERAGLEMQKVLPCWLPRMDKSIEITKQEDKEHGYPQDERNGGAVESNVRASTHRLLAPTSKGSRLLKLLSCKESTCNAEAAGDVSSTPGLGRSSGEGNGNPF